MSEQMMKDGKISNLLKNINTVCESFLFFSQNNNKIKKA